MNSKKRRPLAGGAMSPVAPISTTLRERLLKVLRLAERGVGGERANAQVLLEKMLARHSLTLADLIESGEPRTRNLLDVADEDEITILAQLVDALFGETRQCYRYQTGPKILLGVDASPSERVALDLAWEAFRPAWAEAKADLRVAFLARHQLWDTSRDLAESRRLAADNVTPEEIARRGRVSRMMDGLSHVERPGHRIGRGSAGGGQV